MIPVIPFVSQSRPDTQRDWLESLTSACEGTAEIKSFEVLSDAERQAAKVAIVANPDPAVLERLPNLLWVQSLWAGVERLAAELPADGPMIVRLEDPQMAETMSEAVLAWTLYLHRDMPRYARQQQEKLWNEGPHVLPQERTIAVLGLGNLGRVAAARLKANGFQVTGWSRSPKSLPGIACHHGPEGLATVLNGADITIVLTPLTSETRGMLGAREFAHINKGAAIINFARGPVIRTDALLQALDSGRVGHAVLDVFDEEPLPQSSPLWDHDSVTVLPHISAPTTRSTAAKLVCGNIRSFFATGEIPASVDRKRGY
ncbi:glyoxylate/hydroxypyruvate reductase A [Rhodobacterales bacterium]|nr:glyoxylate/hydroxypyruvate reductase A [Rhodobacterales bacterium]